MNRCKTSSTVWLTQDYMAELFGKSKSIGIQSYDKKADVAIRKNDVSIAKNYLNESEIKLLGLLVEQYLAFADAMVQQQIPIYMTTGFRPSCSMRRFRKPDFKRP